MNKNKNIQEHRNKRKPGLTPTYSQNSFFFQKSQNDFREYESKKTQKDNACKKTDSTNHSTDTEYTSMQEAASQQNNERILKFKKQQQLQNFENVNKPSTKLKSKTKTNAKRQKITEDIIYKLANELANMIETTADELKSKSVTVTECIQNKGTTKTLEDENNYTLKNQTYDELNEFMVNRSLSSEENLSMLLTNLKRNLEVPLNGKYLNLNKKLSEQHIERKDSIPKIRVFKILQTPLDSKKSVKENMKNEKVNYSAKNKSYNLFYQNEADKYCDSSSKDIYCLDNNYKNNILLPACSII